MISGVWGANAAIAVPQLHTRAHTYRAHNHTVDKVYWF